MSGLKNTSLDGWRKREEIYNLVPAKPPPKGTNYFRLCRG